MQQSLYFITNILFRKLFFNLFRNDEFWNTFIFSLAITETSLTFYILLYKNLNKTKI